jgi:succinate dehydrogenase hydrophobic anchor subunit
MVVAVSSTSSSCIQFQLGVQIIFITFFTKHCWHSWFVMGMLSDDMSLSSKEKKTVFGAVVVVVVVVMGLGFTMTVVVQRIYAGGKDWMIA